MFRDTSEELARLEAELLAEEEPVEEEYEDSFDIPLDDEEEYEDNYEEDDYDEPADPAPRGYRVYNTDVTDEDLDDYAEAVLSPDRRGVSVWLVLLLCLLTLGIVALVAVFLCQEGLL